MAKKSGNIKKNGKLTQNNKLSVLHRTNPLFIALFSLSIGVIGTLLIVSSSAAPYAGYFFVDSSNPYSASPYRPAKMGDPMVFRPVYKSANKNPNAKVSCWHMDVEPSFQFYDTGNSALENNVKATTQPMFTKTISPAPPSQTLVTVVLGTAGTGPATCTSQLYDGTLLKSTNSFRVL